MPLAHAAACVEAMLHVAASDPSVARVLREICHLDSPARGAALDLVAAHVRGRGADDAVLACIALLRRDDVAGRIREALGPG